MVHLVPLLLLGSVIARLNQDSSSDVCKDDAVGAAQTPELKALQQAALEAAPEGMPLKATPEGGPGWEDIVMSLDIDALRDMAERSDHLVEKAPLLGLLKFDESAPASMDTYGDEPVKAAPAKNPFDGFAPVMVPRGSHLDGASFGPVSAGSVNLPARKNPFGDSPDNPFDDGLANPFDNAPANPFDDGPVSAAPAMAPASMNPFDGFAPVMVPRGLDGAPFGPVSAASVPAPMNPFGEGPPAGPLGDVAPAPTRKIAVSSHARQFVTALDAKTSWSGAVKPAWVAKNPTEAKWQHELREMLLRDRTQVADEEYLRLIDSTEAGKILQEKASRCMTTGNCNVSEIELVMLEVAIRLDFAREVGDAKGPYADKEMIYKGTVLYMLCKQRGGLCVSSKRSSPFDKIESDVEDKVYLVASQFKKKKTDDEDLRSVSTNGLFAEMTKMKQFATIVKRLQGKLTKFNSLLANRKRPSKSAEAAYQLLRAIKMSEHAGGFQNLVHFPSG